MGETAQPPSRSALEQRLVAELLERRGGVIDGRDRALFDPKTANPEHASMTMSELMQRRARLTDAMAEAEARWVAAAEALETAA